VEAPGFNARPARLDFSPGKQELELKLSRFMLFFRRAEARRFHLVSKTLKCK
jgi:hypothetical protein